MPTSKNFRIIPQTSGVTLPSVPSSVTASRVTVNTVVHRRPSGAAPAAVASSTPVPKPRNPASIHPPADLQNRHPPHQAGPPPREKPLRPMTGVAATSTPISESPQRVPSKPPAALKKDPLASMFVPKRKNTQRVV